MQKKITGLDDRAQKPQSKQFLRMMTLKYQPKIH